MRAAWRRFLAAIQFLTILPVRSESDGNLAPSLPYFPAVGLLLGGALWAAARLLRGWPPTVAGMVLVLAYTLVTGGLHADGLMDTADAVASRLPPGEARRVMKDSRVGALGALAGAALLLWKTACWAALLPRDPLIAMFVPAVSRTALLWALTGPKAATPVPAAGLGAPLQGAVGIPVALGWAGVLAALLYVTAGSRGVATAAGVILAGQLTARWLHRRYGGLSGDMLGAAHEVAEAIGWLFAVVP
jgi:adenosylcobinamide-GDP ribazoletransferase